MFWELKRFAGKQIINKFNFPVWTLPYFAFNRLMDETLYESKYVEHTNLY